MTAFARKLSAHPRLAAAFLFVAAIALADILAPPPLTRAREVSPLILDRHGEWLHGFTTDAGRWRFAVDLDEVDPVFVERLLIVEDKRFYAHPGVDPAAVMRAGASAAQAGRIVSGASTITMQLARLIEPRPRNLGSKAIEMLRALQIERRLSKREILEAYLTLAPYGGNLEGVRAASLAYFGKEPTRLTDSEQALLIALPQAPESRRPDLRPKGAAAGRNEILGKLLAANALDEQHAAEARESVIVSQRKAFDRVAYHAAHELAPAARRAPLRSTLDRQMQEAAEALVARYAESFDDGAAVSLMIVENETRAVRAAVGSPGLDTPGGWIDLTRALRSPGSTLKPFIYALAFEDGLVGASTIIDDMPRSFGGYAPENFDRTFRGEVRAREALQHSLNVPAVRLLDRLGASRLASALGAAGINIVTPDRADKAPGLALALGGAGVSARDLATLYAALGDGGAVRPLNWTENAIGEKTKSYQLMSAATASRISAILASAPALEGRAPADLSRSALRVAFKTGTSYGFRDAWTAGYGGGYTVVTWVGNASGAPRPGATGRKTAAPLLFDAFDLIERHGAAAPDSPALDADPGEGPHIARLDRAAPPEIVFPRAGVEIILPAADRGFSLAARGGAASYQWYVDGEPLHNDGASGRTIWRPGAAGFYTVTVVDGAGKSARAKVRVITG